MRLQLQYPVIIVKTPTKTALEFVTAIIRHLSLVLAGNALTHCHRW
jgi:hypothetical protein